MTPEEVPKHVEEQLRSKLKQRALRRCDKLTQAMVDCSRDRLVSVVWACRDNLRELNECTHRWTEGGQLEDLKRRWIAAGEPSDWRWNPWPEEAGVDAEFEARRQARLAKKP